MMEDDIGNQVNVAFALRGNFCNLWPNCKITLNNELVFDGQVEASVIDAQFKLQKNNIITIEHYGKRFGENHIWDTKVVDGQIIADRYLRVDDIKILDISLKPWWHNGQIGDTEYIPQHLDAIYFHQNITYTLKFTAPFYDWLIDSRYSGFKEVGPIWKMSSLNTKSDGYSSSMLELEPILDRVENTLKKL